MLAGMGVPCLVCGMVMLLLLLLMQLLLVVILLLLLLMHLLLLLLLLMEMALLLRICLLVLRHLFMMVCIVGMFHIGWVHCSSIACAVGHSVVGKRRSGLGSQNLHTGNEDAFVEIESTSVRGYQSH
jgi:predicted membrane protein